MHIVAAGDDGDDVGDDGGDDGTPVKNGAEGDGGSAGAPGGDDGDAGDDGGSVALGGDNGDGGGLGDGSEAQSVQSKPERQGTPPGDWPSSHTPFEPNVFVQPPNKLQV